MWTTRTGETGYCTPYATEGVKTLAGGRIRLTATKTRSAGLLGPFIGHPCRVEVETTGEYHKLHPLAVFAIWTYDDATKNEVDLLEATRWGDRNQPDGYWLTNYEAELMDRRETYPSRAFVRHKITADFGADGWVMITVRGWWVEHWDEDLQQMTNWKKTAWLHCRWWPGQLRIALWTPPGIADALGDCTVTIDKCTVTMASAEVSG